MVHLETVLSCCASEVSRSLLLVICVWLFVCGLLGGHAVMLSCSDPDLGVSAVLTPRSGRARFLKVAPVQIWVFSPMSQMIESNESNDGVQ